MQNQIDNIGKGFSMAKAYNSYDVIVRCRPDNSMYLKPVIVEIALTEHLPYHIRMKAIAVLPNFGDPSIIDSIIPLLENSENYIFYNTIVDMILSLDSMPDYEDALRKVGLRAAENEKEKSQ